MRSIDGLRTALRRFCGCAKGTSAIELAFVLPIVAFLAVGGYDFARALNQGASLESAALAGVQYAMTSPNYNPTSEAATITSEITTVVHTAANDNTITVAARYYCACPESPATSVNCNASCASGITAQKFAEVEVEKVLNFVFDYPGLPADMTLRGSAESRIQ